jgi:hypothetical protein
LVELLELGVALSSNAGWVVQLLKHFLLLWQTLALQVADQADQIGRILASWTKVFYGIFDNCRSAQKFIGHFFSTENFMY